ncbi:MAG: signal peptide peptidase SppA [Proteobacteria bacterium]|nr:signal peptide peptidase SppA [Cystobacterineae bacterium]MCL2259631.1 signal peptide peptidase SppA [Cystobacterineae bacterium]MCL2313845.1 signal peptide peptidase SppA [Pseudomonadota bacterium]
MSKNSGWKWGLLSMAIVIGGVCALGTSCFWFLGKTATISTGSTWTDKRDKRDKIGIVEVLGGIENSREILEDIREVSREDSYKAVIIRIDSPGGAVGASQEIYEALMRLREKKPVVASMENIAASGGYYIASATDTIFANSGTLTASIGVIIASADLSKLMQWAKVDMNVLTAGEQKDVLSPYRPLKDKERAAIKELLSDIHESFIGAVAQGRKKAVEEIRPWADGRIMTGRQAKEAGLVDELGGFEVAVEHIAKRVGMKGKPRLSYVRREKGVFERLFGPTPGQGTQTWVREVVKGVLGAAVEEVQEVPKLKYQP